MLIYAYPTYREITMTLAAVSPLPTQAMLVFSGSESDSARADAIDRLHNATAIYTAEHAVDDVLARLSWPSGSARMVDPSAGEGVFLVRALAKALAARPYTDDEVVSILEGWELHPYACAQARVRVAATLISFGRSASVAQHMAQRMVHNRDFLTEGPTTPTWDRIAGNPPYLRWINVPEFLRAQYNQVVPRYAAGDLAHSFLDRCARVLRPDGEIGFVTSDRWLFNAGSAGLREVLGRHLSIQHIERLDAKSVFHRSKQRRAGTPARVHPVSVHLTHAKGQPLTKAAIYPGTDTERYRGLPTLGDIATVRIAPWLGASGVFVVFHAEAIASRLPLDALVPAIDTDDVAGGILGTPKRFAIKTFPDVRPSAEVMEHIERNIGRMAPSARKGKLWLPPERFHQLDLSQPSLLVPRIAKSPRSVRIPAGILPINHNLSIVAGSPEVLDRVERALASQLASDWVAQHAPRLENGFVSLTTTMLRRLPIAD